MTFSKILTPQADSAGETGISSPDGVFTAGVPMLLLSPELRVLQVNPALAELFAASAEAVAGSSLLDWVAESDRAAVRQRHGEMGADPDVAPAQFLFRAQIRQGKLRYVSARFGLLSESKGCLLTLMDVTREKYSEYLLKKSLREAQQRYAESDKTFKIVEHIKKEWERIIDCVDDMVILTDERGCVKRCNKSLLKQFGASYSDLIGKPFDTLMVDFEITPGMDGEGSDLYHPPSQRWYHVKTYPFYEHDETVSGAVITVHDFTELKQLNDKMAIKGAELEKAYRDLKSTQSKVLHQEKMASVGQLAAGVAHEINNPMGFISSNLSTLDKYLGRLKTYIGMQDELLLAHGSADAKAALSQRRKELKIDHVCSDSVDLIRESLDGAERVKTIVQNLKSFSRVDSVQLSDAQINECLDSTISMVWNEIKYKATLERDYGDLPPLRCFPQQLNQVFMNLIVNAGQALAAQGVIRVKTWLEEGAILVAVTDNGSGIPADQLGRIFEPFFTTKEVGKGTGLGLSISYDIVKKHGGEILVESEVGVGTTFTVRLPLEGSRTERVS